MERIQQHLQHTQKQIVSSIDPIYLHMLPTPIPIHDFLQFLFVTYGHINQTDLLKRQSDRIKLPWDSSNPFELLVDQVDRIEFAEQEISPMLKS